MTFYLLRRGNDPLLASDDPIVKAEQRDVLDDALTLLERLREQQAEQAAAQASAEAKARELGFCEGQRAGRQEFAEAVAELSGQAARHREKEESEIAALAVAALRMMVESIGDEAIVSGIARRAVASVALGGPVLVEAGPAICPAIERALATTEGRERVTVKPDPALTDRQCRITAPDGRIIADLDVQLDAIAERLEGVDVD